MFRYLSSIKSPIPPLRNLGGEFLGNLMFARREGERLPPLVVFQPPSPGDATIHPDTAYR
jgi:hypothetical protein